MSADLSMLEDALYLVQTQRETRRRELVMEEALRRIAEWRCVDDRLPEYHGLCPRCVAASALIRVGIDLQPGLAK